MHHSRIIIVLNSTNHRIPLSNSEHTAEICIEGNCVGEACGNWRAKAFGISINGKEVARSLGRRSATSLGRSSIYGGAGAYIVEVDPGIDTAFLSMVVLALDEMFKCEDDSDEDDEEI